MPCPLCGEGVAWQTQGALACSRNASHGCAFHLFTHDHPAPLQLLRERMSTLLQQHAASGCHGIARCRLPGFGEAGAGRLLLECETCRVQTTVV